MQSNFDISYYLGLEKMLAAMSKAEGFSIDDINSALTDLCKALRISKGVAEYYNNAAYEKQGRGDVFVCYDDGTECKPVMQRRIVSPSMTVCKCTVYMNDNAAPLDKTERERVDMIMRTILSFISRSRLQVIVERLTFYDDNGYRNLRSFMRFIEQLAEKGELSGNTAAHFNLRHFTLINQEIGRSGGDMAIRNYFTLLEETVGESGIVCRVGGDNFVCVFDSGLTDRVVEILKGAPVVYDVAKQNRVMVSSSAGLFHITDDFEYQRPGDIMDRILSSSQAARTGGKDTIMFFDDRMIIGKEKMMKIQQLFPKALENNEFKVFYQPKIDVKTGELIGAEALCRWVRDGKIVPPVEFIPVLEQNTDICLLDFYMLDHVCKDIARWLKEGRKVVRISVNLSRKHMMDVDLLKHIMDIIDSNYIPHEYIEIELTETTTDVEFRDLKRVVSGLQQEGIYTSVDDFGMGYSSLNLIREIPWNVLKVDKSFLPVRDDTENSTRSIMFKYVVAMAKELGLECIAEGVETSDQVQVLRDNDCFYAQGFFFDKPLPLSDFEERLAAHHYNINIDDKEGKKV